MDFKAFMRLPFPDPVLNLPSTSSLHLFSPVWESTFVAICTWRLPCVASAVECWVFAQGLLRAKSRNRHVGASPCAILCSCSGFTPKAGAHSPSWAKPRSGLIKEQELCALFLATRAEFWSTVCQHFLSVISSLAWLTPGSLAATWATWKLLLLRFHDPLPPCTWSFLIYFVTYTKQKGKKPT